MSARTDERNADIVKRFEAGESMPAIGEHYRITKQRVYQILNAEGLTKFDGGFFVSTESRMLNKEKEWQQARAERILKSWGMTVDEYDEHIKKHGNSADEKSPMRHFLNAKQPRRLHKWKMTFKEWWQLWTESGKWSKRGLGRHQYLMARIDTSKPFTVDNVKIIQHRKLFVRGPVKE